MIRIGIVDDEKQERDQLKQALARFGAENGTELNVQEFDCAAVYLAAQDRDFDILYLDIDMPQMSGMELAEKSPGDRSRRHPHFLHEFAAIRAERVQCRRTGLYCKADTVVLLPYVSDAGAEGAAKARRSKVTPPHIVVKDGTVTRLLDAAEIAYVEVRQHDLLYNLCGEDGKTEIIEKPRFDAGNRGAADTLRLCAMQRQLPCEPALYHGGKPV